MREIPKLPQARLYLKAAVWGINDMVERRLQGYAYRFYMIGVLASLRAVQHALLNHDYKISAAHRKIIDEWRRTTPVDVPELAFIKYARDKILKEGSFDSYATSSESGTGEGSNYTSTDHQYDLAYYVGEERHDLLAELHRASAWCESELSTIEAKLPSVFEPE